jgi:hypothetical protein
LAKEQEKTGARARVSEALVCPHCRDGVSRSGTVACARRGCGALYHRECWEECARQYGGCAIYGCESRESKEVSLPGWVARVARLFLVAKLLAPRVPGALGSSVKRAVGPSSPEGTLVLFTGGALVLALGFPLVLGVVFHAPAPAQAPVSDGVLAVQLLAAFSFMCVSPLLAFMFLLSLLWVGARSLHIFFTSELAALARADDPESTVLGRLRSGEGGK